MLESGIPLQHRISLDPAPLGGTAHLDNWGDRMYTFGWAQRLSGLFGRTHHASTPRYVRTGEPFARFLREFKLKNDECLRGTDRGISGMMPR